jgi:DNA polymerase I-like protein with 3'-5' exonuclease and polymerase domains
MSSTAHPLNVETEEDDFFSFASDTRQHVKAQELAEKEARKKNRLGPPVTVQLAEPLHSHGVIENEEAAICPWEWTYYYDEGGNIVDWVFTAEERVDLKTGRKKIVGVILPPDHRQVTDFWPSYKDRVVGKYERPRRKCLYKYKYKYVQIGDVERLEALVEQCLRETSVEPGQPGYEELPEHLKCPSWQRVVSIDYETGGLNPNDAPVYLLAVAWGNPYWKYDPTPAQAEARNFSRRTSKNGRFYRLLDDPQAEWAKYKSRDDYDNPSEGMRCFVVDCRWTLEDSVLGRRAKAALQKLLSEMKGVAHNAQFEDAHTKHHFGVAPNWVLCTQIATEVAYAGYVGNDGFGGASLEDRSGHWLGVQLDKKVRLSFVSMDPTSPLTNKQIAYNAQDACVGLDIYPILMERLREANLWDVWWTIERPLISVLADSWLQGVWVEQDYVKALEDHIKIKVDDAFAAFKAALESEGFPSFSPLSPDQVRAAFKAKGVDLEGTDEEVLFHLLKADGTPHPVAEAILGVRGAVKMASTYMEPYVDQGDIRGKYINPVTRRVHARFNQCQAATGRLSVDSPNLQNIPSRYKDAWRFRRIFKGPPGSQVLTNDYSQIELRILARLSREPSMIETFREGARARQQARPAVAARLEKLEELEEAEGQRGPSGGDLETLGDRETHPAAAETELAEQTAQTYDFHRRTAAAVFQKPLGAVTAEERALMKPVTFGLLYGAEASTLARNAKIPRAAAQQILVDWFAAFPRVKRYLESAAQHVRSGGAAGSFGAERCSRTPAGRKRFYGLPLEAAVPGAFFLPPEPQASSEAKAALERLQGLVRRAGEQAQARIERQAKNHPIQGSNADLLKLALRAVWERCRAINADVGTTLCGILFSVHDEIVCWTLPHERWTVERVNAAIVAEMTAAAQTVLGRPDDPEDLYGVPVEIHSTWSDTWAGPRALSSDDQTPTPPL